MKASGLVTLTAAFTFTALADQRGDTPGSQASTPQEQLAKFHVPPGFEVQLVAAEPEIQKPINLNFDAAGRLWVTGSEMYPWPASTDVNGQPIPDFDEGWRGIVEGFRVGDAPAPQAEARDTVRVLSDFGPDGRARKVRVFADKLNIPSGIQPLPRKPGGYYPQISQIDADREKEAASTSPNLRQSAQSAVNPAPSSAEVKGDTAIVYSIPHIWRLTDVDGDGFAEKREPLYTGFGYTDTHGGASSFIYWIDGWIYGTHGFRNHSEVRDRKGKVTVLDSGNTFRFRPDGSAFEIYTHGQTNPFGLAFDPLGNLFSADSHSKPVYMLIKGGYYEGIGKQHDGLGFAPRITDDDHGSSAIAGIAYYADDKWPAEYRDNLFNGNPVTQRINRDRLEWHGSTPQAIRMPDFLTCDDPWFRPVNLKLGPDGALYIADFYNPIIGHYEVPLTHPARDHTHGRIWRVVYRGGEAPGSTRVPRVGEGVPPSRTSGDDQTTATPPAAAAPHEVRRGETPQPTRETRVLPGTVAPELTALDATGLFEKLADPNLEVRRLATNELVDRVGKVATVEAIKSWFAQSAAPAQNSPGHNADSPQIAGVLKILARLGFLDSKEGGETGLPTFARDAREVLERQGAEVRAQVRRIKTANISEPPIPGLLFDAVELSHGPGEAKAPHARLAIAEAVSAAAEVWAQHPVVPNPAASASPSSPGKDFTRADEHSRPAYRRELQDAIRSLLICWGYTAAPEDTELIHSVRMALRDCIALPYGIEAAQECMASDFLAAEHLADVSLGTRTPESVSFLLTHLGRTKLETPRAGEYLKHALLYLPEEKLGSVAKLLGLVANAPLPRRLSVATNLADAAKQRGAAVPAELTAWSQGVMLETLASNNDELTKPAIAAVRDLKLEAKLAPLAKIARDDTREGGLRQAALEAAANLSASHDLLLAAFADPRHMILRKRAAELLAQNGDTATVLAALPQAPWELALVISAALARTDAGATALLDAIEAGKAPARALTSRALVAGFFSRPKALQERAKALAKDLPPEDARLDRVIADRVKAYRDDARRPDAAKHGAQVFQQTCAVCHRFRNAGGNVGPNLDGVAARGPQRLFEDILDPSRNVDPAFRQTVVELTDGRTFAGTNPREADDALILVDATGTELRLPKTTIKTRSTLNLSMMPPIFETQLSPTELTDLVAYLLGKP